MAENSAIGETPDGPMHLNLERLIGSHACVVANSGGGKSGLLRRILETTHGRIPHIVLDIEDEFYTLRERFDYVIAGGDGGDAPATLDNAESLAIATLTHGFSLIVQLNDLGEDAPEFVGRFLTAMIQSPRALWKPMLVALDETQRFAPQDGNTAATRGVKALTGQGRKRGFTAVLASQRIAKIEADVRGDVNNWMLGRVGQSLDRKTMADALGFAPSSAEARGLQGLPDRTFWGFGPALSRTPILFRVGDVETTPVKPGQAKVVTPPPPEALRSILAGLAEAPPPAMDGASQNAAAPRECCTQLEGERDHLSGETERLRVDRDLWRDRATRFDQQIRNAVQALGFTNINAEAVEPVTIDQVPVAHGIPATAGEGGRNDVDRSTKRAPCEQDAPVAPSAGRAEVLPTRRRTAPLTSGTGSPAAVAIADLLDRVNPARLTWTQAAAMTGRKASGGNFNAARKWLRESGRLIEDGDLIRSSSGAPAGMARADAIALWSSVLTNPAPRMIAAFVERGSLTKDGLGEAIGAQPRGGNFNNGLSQLRRNGLLSETGGGAICLAVPLPGEAS